jgi:HK97 family phage prohead protease
MSETIENTALELTEYKASQGQINIDEAQGIVEAFVAGIGNKDSVGDIIVSGAFADSLKRRKPRVVWGHDWNSPIGKVLEIYEVPRTDQRLPAKMRNAGIGGLYVRVQFNLKSERGRQAFADVSFFGEEQEWSIGYKTLDADFDPARNANVLKKVELYEVSPVLHGANQLTGTISIKADKPLKDPKGGLTSAGRAHFNRTEGSNLKPGVKGPADTPEKMRRKGSFLTRFFTNPSGPMKDEKGRPTRLALSAAAWGEPVPSDREAAAKLAAKGRRLLERYENSKKKKSDAVDIDELYKVAEQLVLEDESFKQEQKAFVLGSLQEKGIVPTPKKGMRPEFENMMRARMMEQFKKQRIMAMLAQMLENRGKDEDENDDDSVEAFKPKLGRAPNLPIALAKKFGGQVRVRESDANSVIFDHRGDRGMSTLRVSYHFEDGKFMFGDPTRVKPKVVYLNMNGDEVPGSSDAERRYEDRYGMDEQPQVPIGVKPKSPEKADPLGGLIPQEVVTARTRGYGPRRGNLERLLRYWRPIMRKPGGFRRCRVILANHPELYPLNNICAWLHHETTGLWPNEGCHHPGMKNCRKKLKGVVRGSIWSDSQFNERLSNLVRRGKKDGFLSENEIFEIFGDQGSEQDNLDLIDVVTEKMALGSMADFETDDPAEEEKQAYDALRNFMNAEPEFTSYMTGDDNWVIEGEDDDDETYEMPMPNMSEGKGGCGCGGSCGGGGKEMIAALAAALADMVKSAESDIQSKSAYVNQENMLRLKEAYSILNTVFQFGGLNEKPHLVQAKGVSVYDLKSSLDPVLEYHGINAQATEKGVKLFGIDCASDEAIDALASVLRALES